MTAGADSGRPGDDGLFDLAIVGGGINGCGIARDAQGRGLRTVLVEQHDLASHTSSASTKLIHGGLRYLEQYRFGMVRKALAEREVLLAAAPHIARPLRFVMPHDPAMRPAWMIHAGIWLYDHLASRTTLPASRRVDLRTHTAGAPLRANYRLGFEYSDGWVDDARLVVLNAVDAARRGARIHTRLRAEAAERHADHWRIHVRPTTGGPVRTLRARALVNAAGPWAGEFLHRTLGIASGHDIRLVKGSHIVVPRLFDHAYAYIFQNSDKRIVFAIPYERDFTLIGTTDVEYEGDPSAASASSGEIDYLCRLASHYFARNVDPASVVHSYSGVRPLVNQRGHDASETSRDYELDLDTQGAPLLSVLGGKITTYRILAEEALARLATARHMEPARHGPAWTAGEALPGGDLPAGGAAAWLQALRERFPQASVSMLDRYVHAYGTLSADILGEDAGAEIAPGLFEAELRHLRDREWARTGEDVLWRRSKLGLHLGQAERQAVERWMED